MKSLRIWLLVLLAFALPMRGAMAAAMLCAPGAGHVQAAAVTGNHHHGPGHGAAASAHAHTSHDKAADTGHDTGDKCGFCASCCSASAPLAAGLAMPQAPPAADGLPSYQGSPAEFFSGGPERPPRSI